MMTLEEIDAQIAALEAAKLRLLTGKQRVRVTASEGGVEYSATSLADLNQELAGLKIERRKLTGERPANGPIGLVMRGRW